MSKFDDIYASAIDSFQPPPEDGLEGIVYSLTRRDCAGCGQYTHWFDISYGVPIRTCGTECRDALQLDYQNSLDKRGC